jgi:O-antigen/teichoic acid export membrane protein
MSAAGRFAGLRTKVATLMSIARGQTARNSALNFLGFATPLVVGVALVPVTLHGIGLARFGLLSLALAILEYSTLFAFGLGPATTKHVAEALARDDERVSELVLMSIASHAVLGSIGGAVVALLAPVLATHVFVVPHEMIGEATTSFRLLGLMIPATLILISLFGALEGASRFGLSNMLRVPISILSFVIPAYAATHGFGLAAIFSALVIARFVICGGMIAIVTRTVPGFAWARPNKWGSFRPMVAFGAWLTVSNVVSPVLVYADRFLLGALKGVAAVGAYAAPFDALMRLLIIPNSITRALFPRVSALYATGERERLKSLAKSATLFVAAVMVVPVALLIAFGPSLLSLWLGSRFAATAGTATRVLAIGLLFNTVATVPFNFLAAVGRPDVPARFHVAELVIHLPLAWWLVGHYGILGAAIAWSIRVTLDALLLFAGAALVLGTSFAGPSPRPIFRRRAAFSSSGET